MKLAYLLTILLSIPQALHSQTDFSQENATQILKVLSVDIGPRPMGSPAEHKALEFAVRKFMEYGCDTAYIMKMNRSSRAITASGIAVGIKRGAHQRMICIGGHIDSAGPEVPGADDDGSGASTVIELARVFGKRHMQSTLLFCCFGGEEQGLEGSRYFVDHFDDIDSVVLMLQTDMANGIGVIDIDPDTHGASAPEWLTRAAIEEFSKLGYSGLRYPTHFFSFNYATPSGSGSDHESFLHAGIPAIDFTTDVSKPIHTPRDNFENFDRRGLKRSGDVVQKLTERFDGGVPDRKTGQYWLLLIGSTPLFLPLWALWLFATASILLGIMAFADVRRRREPPDSPDHVRWSGTKMILFTLCIVACAWFSSDLVGFIKGVRHPTTSDLPWFELLAAAALVFGICLTGQLTRIFPLSRCPFVFFKRAAFFLTLLLVLSTLLGVKVVVYPAFALAFFSLAMLTRHWIPKVIFALIAPIGFVLLLFSEWFGLIVHSFAGMPPVSSAVAFGVNAGIIIFYSFFLLPVLYGLVAVARDTARLRNAGAFLSSKKTVVGSLTICTALCVFLIPRPTYNKLWYRDVYVNQQVDLGKHSKEISIESPEYLSGVRMHYGSSDTMIASKSQTANLIPGPEFDTTWLAITRKEQTRQSGDTCFFDVELSLRSKLRPYTVNVVYSTGRDEIPGFTSPIFSTGERPPGKGEERVFRWYSFPDTNITIPVHFASVGKDSVLEEIEVTYDTLACPMRCERELTSFILRTRYVEEHIYKKWN